MIVNLKYNDRVDLEIPEKIIVNDCGDKLYKG